MNGTLTATGGAQVTIHTYTAPEEGWMTTSHPIELPAQLILADTPLRPDSTNEVLTHAKDHGKPTSRVYISHGHPHHFAGAGLAGAPLHALPPVAAAIDNGGAAILSGALALTGGKDPAKGTSPTVDFTLWEPGGAISPGPPDLRSAHCCASAGRTSDAHTRPRVPEFGFPGSRSKPANHS